MNRLLEIGFGLAGHWHLEEGRLRLAIHQHGSQKNVLYAFACDGNVMYVGKSSQTLRKRMAGYMSHSATALTNIRVRQLIIDMLTAERSVDVYALPDNGLMHYGRFHLNLAAGLEDSIIKMISPPWNISGIGRMNVESDAAVEQALAVEGVEDEITTSFDAPLVSIEISLQKTYRNSGFFNIPMAGSSAIGSDGETIEIFFHKEQTPILGTINRRSNLNNTPRIFGGPELRRRFQTLAEMSKLLIEVDSPVSIRIKSDASLPG